MDYMKLLGKKEYAGALSKGLGGAVESGLKGIDLGAITKNIDAGAITKNIDLGAVTKNIDLGAATKNIDLGAATKNIDLGAATKNVDAAAITKNVDDVAAGAGKQAGKETSTSLAKKAKDMAGKAGDMMKKVDPKVVAAVAAAGGLGLYLVKKVNDMEGKKVGITKVEAGQNGVLGIGGDKKVVLITYDPPLEIRSADTVDISDSKTTPSMDGKDYKIKSVKSTTQIYVTVKSDITEFKEGGQITLHTDFESQAAGMLKDGAEAAGGAASDVTGGLLKGLGIDPTIAMYVGIGLGVLVLLFILMKFMR
jgi:hypothetical protein